MRTSLAVSLASFFGSEAGDEEVVDAGGVAGVGGFAEVVDGDGVEPVREVRGDAALGGGDGDAAVAGGDLVGEFG